MSARGTPSVMELKWCCWLDPLLQLCWSVGRQPSGSPTDSPSHAGELPPLPEVLLPLVADPARQAGGGWPVKELLCKPLSLFLRLVATRQGR